MKQEEPLYKTKPLQSLQEIDAFCKLLAREGVHSYLEIGSKYGGSLWKVAQALPKGSRLVSLDHNINGPSLEACIAELNAIGYDARLIPLLSFDERAINAAKALAPFDALFIDGDHRPPGVWNDWNHYAPLARIVSFHDIGWRRDPSSPKAKSIAVPEIWDEIKKPYRHKEIKLDKSGNNGIGVLWRS